MDLARLLPEIWFLIFDLVHEQDLQTHILGDRSPFLNLALTCKFFARISIPYLYRHVIFRKELLQMRILLQTLLENPQLAQTVQTIRMDGHDGYPLDTWNEEWLDGLPTRDFTSSDGLVSKSVDLAKWPQKGYVLDAMMGMILLCCPNITLLDFSEEDILEDPDDDENEIERAQVFLPDFWPWRRLKQITVAANLNTGEDTALNYFLPGQIFDAAHAAAPSDFVLDSLSVRQYSPIADLGLVGPDGRFAVRKLEITDLPDDYLNDHTHIWSSPLHIIASCRKIQHFRVRQEIDSSTGSLAWQNNTINLIDALRAHQKTLRTIDIDLWSPADYRENDTSRWEEDTDVREPRPKEAIDWTMFENLTSLAIPMPFIMGRRFFCHLPQMIKQDRSFEYSPPAPDFSDGFSNSLIDNLPRGLEELTLWWDEVVQEEAVNVAVQRLEQIKASRFPMLRSIELRNVRPS